MVRQAFESDVDIELDSTRLSQSYSTSDQSLMSGVIPQGSKLFGCMAIFLLFSGGFAGSLFALETFEDPEPYLFNARILKFPGIDENNCQEFEACFLTGIVQLRPVQLLNKEYKKGTVKVKATVNGVMNNITVLEIHDVNPLASKVSHDDYCDLHENIGASFYLQAVTQLESVVHPKETESAYATMRIDTAETSDYDINFKYVHANSLAKPYLSNYRITNSFQCGELGEDYDYGGTLEIVRPALFASENVTGAVALSTAEGDSLFISYDLQLPVEADGNDRSIKKIKILDAKSCVDVDTSAPVFSNNGDVYDAMDITGAKNEANEYKGDVTVNIKNGDSHALFDRAVVLLDSDDRLISCTTVPGSVFTSNSGNNITEVGDEVTLHFGYTMSTIQKHAVTLSNADDSKVVACGIIPGNPYTEHPSVSSYNHEPGRGNIENSKRVTTEFELEAGYDFADFQHKIVVLKDKEMRPVGCGVFVGTDES